MLVVHPEVSNLALTLSLKQLRENVEVRTMFFQYFDVLSFFLLRPDRATRIRLHMRYVILACF